MDRFCVSLIIFTLFCQACVFPTFINFSTYKKKPRQEETNSKFGTPWPTTNQCSCKPAYQCSYPYNATTTIDIRIVTRPGTACRDGTIFCCSSQESKSCGKQLKIPISGVSLTQGQAQFGEYPWQVIIQNYDNDYIGSGALIDNLHVLTTAHKVAKHEKSNLIIRLGDWNLQSDVEPYEPVEVRIAYISIHPQYNSTNLAYDIAIITLDQAIRTYPHIQPVCLPMTNELFVGKRCWVSGWGKDMFGESGHYQNIQKHVDITILNDNDCESKLRSTRLGSNFVLNRQSFVCAGGENGKDACTGDGGSPLVCQVYGQWYLVGLVAWGIGCAQYNIPGVYVDIVSLLPWIKQCL